MQRYFPAALERLTEEFAKLPGIGGKTEIHGDDDGKQPNGPLLFLGAPVAAE